MSVTFSQDLNRSAAVNPLLQGIAARGVQDGSEQPQQAPRKNAEPQGQGVRSSAAVLAMLDSETLQKAEYDEPGQRQRKAISAYQSLSGQDKREQLQNLFSVDLYA